MKYHTFTKQFFFLFLLLFPLLGQGQYRVDWEEHQEDSLYPPVGVVEYNNNFFVARRNRKKASGAMDSQLRIERRSIELKVEKKEDFNLKFEKKKFTFLKFVVFNDKLFFLARSRYRKQRYRMVLSVLDTETLRPGGIQFEFYTKEKNPTLYVTNKGVNGEQELIVVGNVFEKGTLKLELNTYVLDTNLHVSYSHKSKVHLKSANAFKIKKVQMDNKRNLYILGTEQPAEMHEIGHPVSRGNVIKGHLFKIDTRKGEGEHELIKIRKGNFLRDINFLLDTEKITIVGLYSEKELKKRKPMTVKGVFIKQTTLEDWTDFKTKHYPIDRKYAHYSLKKSEIKKLDKHNITKEMTLLTLKDILFWGDDKILIVSEIMMTTIHDQGKISYVTGDMIVWACDKKANLIWTNNIPKKEKDSSSPTVNLLSTSYIMHVDDEKVNFFYQSGNLIPVKRKSKKDFHSTFWDGPLAKEGFLYTGLSAVDGANTTSPVDLTGFKDKRYVKICPTSYLLLKNGSYLVYAKLNQIGKGRFGIMHFE